MEFQQLVRIKAMLTINYRDVSLDLLVLIANMYMCADFRVKLLYFYKYRYGW